MDVFSKYFRRLLQQNAAQVFPGSGRTDTHGSYPILVGELQKIRTDIQQADKIAESISAAEGEFSRDFDLSSFIDHFKLDIYAKIALASAFKRAAKGDLKTKGTPPRTQSYFTSPAQIILPPPTHTNIFQPMPFSLTPLNPSLPPCQTRTGRRTTSLQPISQLCWSGLDVTRLVTGTRKRKLISITLLPLDTKL